VLGVLAARPAFASVARAVRVEDLLKRSRHVLVGEPLEAYSIWERIGPSKHIVTYTRIKAHDVLAGQDPDQDELLVRTLGGRVGELGELVHGEAQLSLGARGVLFVMQVDEALAVTAMAQGHYPLKRQSNTERLLRSPAAVELVGEAGAAVERLPGLDVQAARTLLRQAVMK
jgi:hypothetical protein